jgi:hypothetical protein
VACIIRAIWSEAPPAPAATHDFDGLGRIPTGDGQRVARSAKALKKIAIVSLV